MTSQATMGSGDSENAKIGAVSAVVVGILFVAFRISLPVPAQTAQEAFANFDSQRNVWIVLQVLSVLIVFFGIVAVASIRNVLKAKDNTLATAAATFFVVGLVVSCAFFLATNTMFSGLAAIYSSTTSTAQDRAMAVLVEEARHSARIDYLVLGAIAAGILLFGLVMRNSKTFPNWLSYVGIVGGIVGIVSLVPEVSSIYATVLGLLFSVVILAWIFATAGFLWRSAGSTAAS